MDLQLHDQNLAAWERIKNFPENVSWMTDGNQIGFYKILWWVRSQWFLNDEQFKDFTVNDMDRLLGTPWMVESRSGESYSGNATLAQCWDMIGYNYTDFLAGGTPTIIQHINEALSGSVTTEGHGTIIEFHDCL